MDREGGDRRPKEGRTMGAAAGPRLADVRMTDVAEVGGKAASLGELLAAGVRVPEGVVLTAGAAALAAHERRSLLWVGAGDLGVGPFAVRSSGITEDGAERSYAGIYESVLDVSADELPAATERCLASARAARVTEYEGGTNGHMAVIIQRMVRPVAAGVALTADPINGDRRSCVVSAVRGAGDRLVSGAAPGGEWIGEPVTPLFESWLLSAMEERMHAWFFAMIGQRAPRPHHVVVNGWYFYSLNWIGPAAILRNLPRMLWHLARHPRRVAGLIPPTVRHSFPILEREWRAGFPPRDR